MNSSNFDSLGKEDAWIVVEDGEPELEGMTLAADRESGDIVILSTRSCRNEQLRGSMPSLEAYPHLRVVDLHNYRIMRNLHESICHLPVLQKLTISRCDFLKKLPASIGKLESLVEVSFPFNFRFVYEADLGRALTSALVLFCSCLHRSLIFLILSNCRRFLKKSPIVKGMHFIFIFFVELSKELRCNEWFGFIIFIHEIGILTSVVDHLLFVSLFFKMNSLKRLRLGGSPGVANKSLIRLPDSLGDLANLEDLILDKCKRLKTLPSSLGGLRNLQRLSLRECKELTFLPPSIVRCRNIRELCLLKCTSLKHLPSDIGDLRFLEDLNMMKCKSLTEIPRSIGSCEYLAFLDLRNCKNLASLPDEIGGLSRMTSLQLGGCASLVEIPELIGELPRLEVLDFENCTSLKAIPVSCNNFMHNDDEEK